uniref:Protein OSCP1 n=1 Tax=Ciona savignyi TaxID=51511 RepID=H2YM14_CIOSA
HLKMALKTLPILFYNLGGEMLYVLDQRLQAQTIAADRSKQVIDDIIGTMFNPQLLNEMMKPQMLYSKLAMRNMFGKLVHSSIMRVNPDSMEKLYDLMVMAVKYQVTQSPDPFTLLHITLNHLDSVMKFAGSNHAVVNKVKFVYKAIVKEYGSMGAFEFIQIRQCLLAFLQDVNNKVSIYLTGKVQNDEGRFVIKKSGEVPKGCDVPGTIRIFRGKKIEKEKFNSETKFTPNIAVFGVSNEMGGKRSTLLGTNVYVNCGSTDYFIATDGSVSSTVQEGHRRAKAELNLLAQLIGTTHNANSGQDFKLQLFEDNNTTPVTPKATIPTATPNVVDIQAQRSGRDQLSQIVNELTIEPTASQTSAGEDLLSLMDL